MPSQELVIRFHLQHLYNWIKSFLLEVPEKLYGFWAIQKWLSLFICNSGNPVSQVQHQFSQEDFVSLWEVYKVSLRSSKMFGYIWFSEHHSQLWNSRCWSHNQCFQDVFFTGSIDIYETYANNCITMKIRILIRFSEFGGIKQRDKDKCCISMYKDCLLNCY